MCIRKRFPVSSSYLAPLNFLNMPINHNAYYFISLTPVCVLCLSNTQMDTHLLFYMNKVYFHACTKLFGNRLGCRTLAFFLPLLLSWFSISRTGAPAEWKHFFNRRTHAGLSSHCNGSTVGVSNFSIYRYFTPFLFLCSFTLVFNNLLLLKWIKIINKSIVAPFGCFIIGQRSSTFRTLFKKMWKGWWLRNCTFLPLPQVAKRKWMLIIASPNQALLRLQVFLVLRYSGLGCNKCVSGGDKTQWLPHFPYKSSRTSY